MRLMSEKVSGSPSASVAVAVKVKRPSVTVLSPISASTTSFSPSASLTVIVMVQTLHTVAVVARTSRCVPDPVLRRREVEQARARVDVAPTGKPDRART
jgi:hypothetical protein